MSDERPNWVDRRALREKVLRDCAEDVWHNARAAMQDSCESFRKFYKPEVEDKTENTHRLRITVPFQLRDAFGSIEAVKRIVLVAFNKTSLEITVAVDGMASQRFQVDADEQHAYITDEGREISLDMFSQRALELALSKAPERQRRSPDSSREF